MKKTINRVVCDTETATQLGVKCVGEFGMADGYEEKLFVSKTGKFFVYGVGGAESIYAEPDIKVLKPEEADAWKKENNI